VNIRFKKFNHEKQNFFGAALIRWRRQLGFARENWPVPDDAIKARDAAWDQYEQQVISNCAPVIAEWEKKGKPFIPWAALPGICRRRKCRRFPARKAAGNFPSADAAEKFLW
jgi:hypothetical protein